jgi:putative acetyltransferase
MSISDSSVRVRTERPGEESRVRAVNDAAFGGPTEGGIVDAIRGTDRWIAGGSLVAESTAGEIIGHLLMSEGDLASRDGRVRRIWMVGPVAVVPEWQRRGVGARLMRAAIELAVERGLPVLCLLGHATYYPRFGFEPARAIGIEPPRPWGDENWLALRLPGWTPEITGTASYPSAFPLD